MKTKFAATCFLLGAFLLPVAGHAADGEKDRSSPKAFVKDSIITTKIKAKLAEEKIASTVNISVDTDNKGMVVLSGTAKTQAEIDSAKAKWELIGKVAALLLGSGSFIYLIVEAIAK